MISGQLIIMDCALNYNRLYQYDKAIIEGKKLWIYMKNGIQNLNQSGHIQA